MTTGLLLLAFGIVVDVFFFATASTTLSLCLLLWLIAVSSSFGGNGGVSARHSFVIIALNLSFLICCHRPVPP
jgi:hypothetical protein